MRPEVAVELEKQAAYSPSPEFMKQFVALTEGGTTREIWSVG